MPPGEQPPRSPETRDVEVRGHGFEPGSRVPIRLGSYEDPPSAIADVDAVGSLRATVPVVVPMEASGVRVLVGDAGGVIAEAYLQVPCLPTLQVDPTCADPAASFDLALVASNFQPDTEIRVGLVGLPDGDVISEPLTTDGDGRLEHTLPDVGPVPEGIYYAVAAQGIGGSRTMARAVVRNPWVAATPFELPCPGRPTLSLDPDCGPIGSPQDRYAVTVRGTGFEPGEATITWDTGGSNETILVRVEKDGTFVAPIEPWRRGRMRIRVRATQRFPQSSEASGPAAYSADWRPRRAVATTFTVPCAPTVLTLDPDCDRPALRGEDERRLTLDVRGSGVRVSSIVSRAPTMELVFDADGAAADVLEPERFPVDVGVDGTLSTTVTPLARPVGEYRVALVIDGQPLAQATFRVPCEPARPSLRPLQPDCLPLAPGQPAVADLRVRGRRFYPGPVEVLFGEQGARDATSGVVAEDGTFDVTLPVTGREPGTHQAQARQRDTRGSVVARAFRSLEVPCIDPVISVSPTSGPAGFATIVSGTGFPLDATITLTWDRGLTAGRPITLTTDATGAFRVGVYVLPNDVEGPRTLTAGTPQDANAFPGVSAAYLVVPGSGQPPGAVDRR
ncbi:MAG: hypothetical protein R3C32_13095 [Chloroflexota bacterium]